MTVEITFWTMFKQSFSWLRAVAMASILVAMAISVAKGHWELLLWQAVALMGVLTEWVMAAEIMAREIICDAQKTYIEALERTSEAVIAKREDGISAKRKPWENDPAALTADQTSPMVST